MIHLKKFLLIYLFILFSASCADKQNNKLPADKNANDVASLFNETPGAELLKANCITCHSLRYIEMQPPFPRKTWEKIVDKMVKNFGAPIPDSSAKMIVDYLVAVKGKNK